MEKKNANIPLTGYHTQEIKDATKKAVLACYGVVGIVKRIRANIAINAARDEAKKQAAQSASTYGYDVFGTESAEDADEYLPCEDNTAYDSTPTETAAPTEDID